MIGRLLHFLAFASFTTFLPAFCTRILHHNLNQIEQHHTFDCSINGEWRRVNQTKHFNSSDQQWQEILLLMDKQVPKCRDAVNSADFNKVRVCARDNFYEGSQVMELRASGALYAPERNDMVLVLVSGCLRCSGGRGLTTNQKALRMSLLKFHPEGSFFTRCEAEWQTHSSVEIDLRPIQQMKTTDAVPFIIGAIFYERRCWGLFGADQFEMSHRLKLRIENVHCGQRNGATIEVPLDRIDTEKYSNRTVEFVFREPIELGEADKQQRVTLIWGADDVERRHEYAAAAKFSQNIDCTRILQNDTDYIAERIQHRLQHDSNDEDLDLSCQAILGRHNFFRGPTNISQQELDFPLAFAKAVFRDYKMLENELAANYVPHNFYCFAIDRKSSDLFHRQIHALAKCVGDNVVVLDRDQEMEMDSYGQNLITSKLECIKKLRKWEWKYVFLLQNHDVQLKTNRELVQILRWYEGANDIQYTPQGSFNVNFGSSNWTLAYLHLFRDESRNQQTDAEGNLLELRKNKGQSEMALSRPFINWLFDELNTKVMLDQLNTYWYANDEYFMGTLAANEFLEAPGGFTQKCFEEGVLAPGFTRSTTWMTIRSSKCPSRLIRHNICHAGLEDLVSMLSDTPFMFFNKMKPQLDAEAIQCWHEEMERRNEEPVERNLARVTKYKDYYRQLPQVRYNREKKQNPSFNLSQFECCYKYLDAVKQYQEWDVHWGCRSWLYIVLIRIRIYSLLLVFLACLVLAFRYVHFAARREMYTPKRMVFLYEKNL